MMLCKACVHPDVLSIDTALLAGESQRKVAARFGLSKDGVRRHVDRDLAQPPVPGERKPHEPTTGDVRELTALEEIRGLVKSLKETPTAGLTPAVQMAIAREKRLAVVELAKIAPPPPPNGGIDWSQSEEWNEFSAWWEAWILTRDPTRALLHDWNAAVKERLAQERERETTS